ncbi:MAG TPA: SpoIIE family protein phosphatase [Candidatus Sulfotelmatobacter sp.]|nr:SpoIIE family protein phosphatase [Candidatus Sulfotelmatobacter sp.]
MLSHFRSDAAAPAIMEPVPTVFPTIAGADIAAMFVGKRVAGDFYDAIRVSSERVLIGLLDVAGRREENRNLLVAAQEVFRTVALQLFSPRDINESDAMTELCLRINRRLIDVCCGAHSCPAFIACYHEQFGTLCYTNAGHTPALLRDASGVVELGPTGLPLGLFSHATCEAPTVGMAKQASLLLVSRGVIDCEGQGNGHSGGFGLERVKEGFQSAAASAARPLCDSVLEAVAEFSGKGPICDDRTALALVRTA